ncbi:MAG: hypothetical protein M1834_001900 [Cirrosporium novae-zelandiae]|nr:MAG: hypothetical protein M1834_001900 [Cirrosporium novae-zelandiae]
MTSRVPTQRSLEEVDTENSHQYRILESPTARYRLKHPPKIPHQAPPRLSSRSSSYSYEDSIDSPLETISEEPSPNILRSLLSPRKSLNALISPRKTKSSDELSRDIFHKNNNKYNTTHTAAPPRESVLSLFSSPKSPTPLPNHENISRRNLTGPIAAFSPPSRIPRILKIDAQVMPPQDKQEKRAAAREVIDILHEISTLLNTHLDRSQLSLCASLIENGVRPEALATVILELREEGDRVREEHGDVRIGDEGR